MVVLNLNTKLHSLVIYDLNNKSVLALPRAAIGDTHSGGDIGDRDNNFVGIDIENAGQRPAWYRDANCRRNSHFSKVFNFLTISKTDLVESILQLKGK